MNTFQLVLPRNKQPLPVELALLTAPVFVEEPSLAGEYVGQTEGVLLDQAHYPVAFVVALAERLTGKGLSRTFVPTSAIRVEDPSTIRVSWTEAQILAQPRIGSDLQLHNRVDGGLPQDSQWMPARPNVVPPGGGSDVPEAVKGGLWGGAAAGAIGAVAGLVAAGPLGAAALAIFFAAGGALAGLIGGAAHETAADASDFREETSGRAHSSTSKAQPALMKLGHVLEDPAMASALSVADLQVVQGTTVELRFGPLLPEA